MTLCVFRRGPLTLVHRNSCLPRPRGASVAWVSSGILLYPPLMLCAQSASLGGWTCLQDDQLPFIVVHGGIVKYTSLYVGQGWLIQLETCTVNERNVVFLNMTFSRKFALRLARFHVLYWFRDKRLKMVFTSLTNELSLLIIQCLLFDVIYRGCTLFPYWCTLWFIINIIETQFIHAFLSLHKIIVDTWIGSRVQEYIDSSFDKKVLQFDASK